MKRPSKVSSCPWEKSKSQLYEGEWEGVSNICVSLTGQRRCHHVRSSHGRDPEHSQEFTIEISLDSWNLINFYLCIFSRLSVKSVAFRLFGAIYCNI